MHALETGSAHQELIRLYLTMINAAMITLLTDTQRYRALMMILQSHKTQIMICEMPTLCHISCASKTYQILSPLLFQQSQYFFLLIHRIFIYSYDIIT